MHVVPRVSQGLYFGHLRQTSPRFRPFLALAPGPSSYFPAWLLFAGSLPQRFLVVASRGPSGGETRPQALWNKNVDTVNAQTCLSYCTVRSTTRNTAVNIGLVGQETTLFIQFFFVGRQSTSSSPRNPINDPPVPVLLEDPVPREPGVEMTK